MYSVTLNVKENISGKTPTETTVTFSMKEIKQQIIRTTILEAMMQKTIELFE